MLARMNVATVRALNAINRAFYAAQADEWQASRQHAWPGFRRVLEAATARSGEAPLRVLDVGAGDGRFGEFLSEQQAARLEYTGVDVSEELLTRARTRRLPPACKLVHADIVDDAQWLSQLALAPQTLVTLFGVMHHVPSMTQRKRLLATLGAQLSPGGVMAVTFWQLHEDPRFEKRVIPWSTYNSGAARPIVESELEHGDYLLSWGEKRATLGAVRYCHFANDAEINSLIDASGLAMSERFLADGRGGALNDYVLLSPRI